MLVWKMFSPVWPAGCAAALLGIELEIDFRSTQGHRHESVYVWSRILYLIRHEETFSFFVFLSQCLLCCHGSGVLLCVLQELLASHGLDDGAQLGDQAGLGDLPDGAFCVPGPAHGDPDGALKLLLLLEGKGQRVDLVEADGSVPLLWDDDSGQLRVLPGGRWLRFEPETPLFGPWWLKPRPAPLTPPRQREVHHLWLARIFLCPFVLQEIWNYVISSKGLPDEASLVLDLAVLFLLYGRRQWALNFHCALCEDVFQLDCSLPLALLFSHRSLRRWGFWRRRGFCCGQGFCMHDTVILFQKFCLLRMSLICSWVRLLLLTHFPPSFKLPEEHLFLCFLLLFLLLLQVNTFKDCFVSSAAVGMVLN